MLKANLAMTCVLGAALAVTASAQLAPPAREIPIYSGVAPGSEKWNYSEKTAGSPDKPQAQNIVRPVLLYYPAPKPNSVGTAMIVAPGGGFRTLMMSHEGVDVAKRLNEMGVDAFVLKYGTIYVGPDAPAGGRGSQQPVRKRSRIYARWLARTGSRRSGSCGCMPPIMVSSLIGSGSSVIL